MTIIDPRDIYDVDACEDRANDLHAALDQHGIINFVHQDRGPWGVRVPLTTDPGEFSPCLYIFTEGTESVAGFEDTWIWHGQISGFPEEMDNDITDTDFRWIERHWMGHTTGSVADAAAPLIRVLRHGAGQALAGA